MCYSVRCDLFYPFSRDLNTAHIFQSEVTRKRQQSLDPNHTILCRTKSRTTDKHTRNPCTCSNTVFFDMTEAAASLTGWCRRKWTKTPPLRLRRRSRLPRPCRRRGRPPASRGRRSAGPRRSGGARTRRGGRTRPTWTCRTSHTLPGSTWLQRLGAPPALPLFCSPRRLSRCSKKKAA